MRQVWKLLSAIVAIAFISASDLAAQGTIKLCVPTPGSSTASCTDVGATNPLPVTGGTSSGLTFTTSTLNGWTSATALNATQTLMPITSLYGAAVLVQLNQTSTIAAGAVTFEGTYDGTNWVSVPVAQILNPNTFANLTNPYTLVASTNQPFLLLGQGYQSLRIKLSTQITGSATVTPFVTLVPFLPVDPALLNPLAAGSAIIGKVGIDQTTPGTTNAVQAIPGTSGGLSWYFVQPAASDNHVVIKAGAGQVYHISATNNSATINYLRLYNATTGFNGCNSATNIIGQWAIPASTSGAGIVVPIDAAGIAFSTGISICVTSGYATTDTTNATASAMSVNVGYK